MKTISIPEYNNPFVVNINNKEYIYKAGATIEVPDEVAEAIEDALELVPKPKRYLSTYDLYVEGKLTELKEEDFRNVGRISDYAFYGCEQLKSVTIPKGVASIGIAAFRYCISLTRVDISEDVLFIWGKAFGDCAKLERVILRGTTPPTIQAEVFLKVPTTCVFEVPSEAIEAYKTADFWYSFANQIKAIEE